MSNIPVVPESTRRSNAAARKRLQRWRAQYNLLGKMIRNAKDILAETSKNSPQGVSTATLNLELIALRDRAYLMMLERGDIAWELRTTSYRYAERSAVEAAKANITPAGWHNLENVR